MKAPGELFRATDMITTTRFPLSIYVLMSWWRLRIPVSRINSAQTAGMLRPIGIAVNLTNLRCITAILGQAYKLSCRLCYLFSSFLYLTSLRLHISWP